MRQESGCSGKKKREERALGRKRRGGKRVDALRRKKKLEET